MKSIKKIAALVLAICMFAGLLSGCTYTAEGKALYDAMVKAQSIKSCQSDMQFALRLDATGLSGQDQQTFNQIKAMLNGAKFTLNMKQTANADKTAIKAQADENVNFAGMAMNMGVWVDMDMTGSTPKLKEIVKLPAMLTAMDPSMAGKEYMVMDLGKILEGSGSNGQAQGADVAAVIKTAKEFQPKLEAFMSKYLLQYDPGFKFITDAGTKNITTPEGTVKAHLYQVKLDDKAAKQLIRYTVNNLANNQDAMDFTVEYLKLIQQLTAAVPSANSSAADMDKMMAGLIKEKPAMLEKFNKFMDSIQNIQLVGDKGILIEYAIDGNGNIVSQSGSMDFVIDEAKLSSIDGLNSAKTTGSGIYNVGFDFNVLMYNINKDIAIELPALTEQNSINYTDMLKSMGTVQTAPVQTVPAQVKTPAVPAVKAPVKPQLTVSKKLAATYNKVTYLPARDVVKLIKGGTYAYSNGTATIKANGKTLTLVTGKTTIKINGKEIKLKAVNGKIIGGKLYISLEVLEQLGYNVVLK